MNKRAQQWTLIIGAVLGVAVFLISIKACTNYTGMFTSPSDQAAIYTLGRLNADIKELLPKPGFQYKEIPFMLESDYVIVGFNKEWNNNKNTDGCDPIEPVRKPNECKDQACLCLYKYSDEDFEDMELIAGKCQLIDADYITSWKTDKEEDKISKNFVGENFNNIKYYQGQYTYLFIYGECDGWYDDEPLQGIDLYIEKYNDKSLVNIFIAPKSAETDKRIEKLGQKS